MRNVDINSGFNESSMSSEVIFIRPLGIKSVFVVWLAILVGSLVGASIATPLVARGYAEDLTILTCALFAAIPLCWTIWRSLKANYEHVHPYRRLVRNVVPLALHLETASNGPVDTDAYTQEIVSGAWERLATRTLSDRYFDSLVSHMRYESPESEADRRQLLLRCLRVIESELPIEDIPGLLRQLPNDIHRDLLVAYGVHGKTIEEIALEFQRDLKWTEENLRRARVVFAKELWRTVQDRQEETDRLLKDVHGRLQMTVLHASEQVPVMGNLRWRYQMARRLLALTSSLFSRLYLRQKDESDMIAKMVADYTERSRKHSSVFNRAR